MRILILVLLTVVCTGGRPCTSRSRNNMKQLGRSLLLVRIFTLNKYLSDLVFLFQLIYWHPMTWIFCLAWHRACYSVETIKRLEIVLNWFFKRYFWRKLAFIGPERSPNGTSFRRPLLLPSCFGLLPQPNLQPKTTRLIYYYVTANNV